MTHDELLAKIDYYLVPTYEMTGDDKIRNSAIGFMKALRAVVELHKPYTMDSGSGEVLGCSCIPELPAFLNPYPCATIQAIEKELV